MKLAETLWRSVYTKNISHFTGISVPNTLNIAYMSYSCGLCGNGDVVTPQTCNLLLTESHIH
jgi:hypothetical protein